MDFYSNYEAPNDYRNYLRHHGVKGMKWGVRHDEDRLSYRKYKKITNERRNSYQSTKEAKERSKKRSVLEREMEKIYDSMLNSKHDDPDYHEYKNTPQWKKYMALNKQIDRIKSDDYDAYRQYVFGDLINQYGKERIDKLETTETIRDGLKALAYITAPVAIAGGAIYGINKLSKMK